MAESLFRSRSEESAKRKQSKARRKKRKADADPPTYKKVCLCYEVSNLVAGLPLDDLQAAKEFVEALKLKNPTVAQQV